MTSFWLYLEASDTSKTYTDEKVSHYTRIYFVIDWAKSYFIQLLLLYVPYHWYLFHESGAKKSLYCSMLAVLETKVSRLVNSG